MPKLNNPAGILLDTHIWLWLAEQNPRLNVRTVRRLHQAVEQGNLWAHVITTHWPSR